LKDEKDKRRQNDRDAEKDVDALKDKLQEKEIEFTKLSELKRNIEKELDSVKGQVQL
jgi:predicted  nucleic acid-binding Zn-ribbon protein